MISSRFVPRLGYGKEAASDALLSLDARSADLIAGGQREYDLRFRVVEWWGELRQLLEKGQI